LADGVVGAIRESPYPLIDFGKETIGLIVGHATHAPLDTRETRDAGNLA